MKKTKIKIQFFLVGLIFLGVFFIFIADGQAKTLEDCQSQFSNCLDEDYVCRSLFDECVNSITSGETSSNSSSNADSIYGSYSSCIFQDIDGGCYANREEYCAAVEDQEACGNVGCNTRYQSSDGGCYSNKEEYCRFVEDYEVCGSGGCNTNYQSSDGGCYANKEEYCKAVEDQEVCGVNNPAAGQTVVSNRPISSSQGILSAGTTIDTSTGTAVTPEGKTVLLNSSEWTAVEDNIANSGNGGLVMCANGILYSTCDGVAGGVYTGSDYSAGSAFTVLGNSNYHPGNTAIAPKAGGVTGPKCGVGFEEVSGVCFPLNTGLSTASIYSILTNLFSWLMGLFTTFAVLAFVISGVQYLTSAGNEDLAKTAKANATNAILGIIVGLSGFIIVRAVAAALSGQGWFF